MSTSLPSFRAPTAPERIFNRVFGFFVGLGLAPGPMYLLEVRGRKSGKAYRTPVDLLEFQGKQYLVAPRGRTQWVRNAEAAGEVVLKRGSHRRTYKLRPVAAAERPPYLKAYLDRFKVEVQRYFPVQAGSPPEAFATVAESYPVFELLAA
jgi:deazaflavin-dependent oxidoreductase (nitroreductase family)